MRVNPDPRYGSLWVYGKQKATGMVYVGHRSGTDGVGARFFWRQPDPRAGRRRQRGASWPVRKVVFKIITAHARDMYFFPSEMTLVSYFFFRTLSPKGGGAFFQDHIHSGMQFTRYAYCFDVDGGQ